MSSPLWLSIWNPVLVAVCLSVGLGHCWWFKVELQGVLAWLGSDPLPLPGLGYRGREAAVWETTVCPLLGQYLSSMLLPTFPTWTFFRFSKSFLYSCFCFSVIVFFPSFCDIKCTHASPFPFCLLFLFLNVFFLTYLFSRLFFLLPRPPFSVHLLLSL